MVNFIYFFVKQVKGKGEVLFADRNILIDLLRGISILMVVFSHFNVIGNVVNTQNYHLLGRSLADILQGMGYYGVVVFFVISGFLITSMTIRRYDKLPNINISEFWWFRFSRIMPMLTLCIISIVVFDLYKLPQCSINSSDDLIRGISSILSFRFNEIMGSVLPSSWNPLWSLSVEEMFYLFFPLLCVLLTGFGSIIWIFLIIFSSITFIKYSNTVSPFSTLANVDYLALGCLAALGKPHYLNLFKSKTSTVSAKWILVLLSLGIICFSVVISDPFKTHIYTFMCAFGAVLFLKASQLGSNSKLIFYFLIPICCCGAVSYELYLIHLPLRELLYLYGIQNLLGQLFIIFFISISLHLTFSEPINYNLRNWVKIKAGGNSPNKKIIYHFVPYVFLIFIAPLFCLNLDNKSISVEFTNIAPLPAETVEPVVVMGYRSHGDMVFMKHTNEKNIQFGIDHWGSHPALSKELKLHSVINRPITIKFGIKNTQVLLGSEVVVSNTEVPFGTSKKIEVGLNTQGFSLAIPKAISEFHILK